MKVLESGLKKSRVVVLRPGPSALPFDKLRTALRTYAALRFFGVVLVCLAGGGPARADYSQLAKLTASDANAGDWFGGGVAISGTTALVGARYDDDASGDSGSAYLYDFSDPNNITEIKLTASDAAAGDVFGHLVAISGTTALVGAHGNDDAGSESGSAYLFDVATGVQLFKLTASDANAPGTGSASPWPSAAPPPSWGHVVMTTPAAVPARPTCTISAIQTTLSKPS